MDNETWFLIIFLICFKLFVLWAIWPRPEPKKVVVKKNNPFIIVRKDK